MARPAKPHLNVFQNGSLVGSLRKASSGAIEFQYAAEWLGREAPWPISLSLPLRENRYVGEPVVAVFENLLPEGETVRARLAGRTGAAGPDAYSLLAAVGRDCVGALQFMASDEDPPEPGHLKAEPVDDVAIGRILRDLAANPLGVTDDDDFRISITGAQDKTALLWIDGGWARPHGATPTTHILKPPIGRGPRDADLSLSVENEYFCLKVARALGLPVANAEITEFDGQKALVVERFDRRWEGRQLLRLPQEDFCQALSVPSSRKYQRDGGPGIVRIMQALGGSDYPDDDRLTFFKSTLLFWLLGAPDGHAKNFSIFLSPTGFRLTPIYDVMSVQPNVDKGDWPHNRFRLAMSVGDKNHYEIEDIVARHFVETAKKTGFGARGVDIMLDQVAEVAAGAIDEVVAALPHGFDERLALSIANGFKRRAAQIPHLRG